MMLPKPAQGTGRILPGAGDVMSKKKLNQEIANQKRMLNFEELAIYIGLSPQTIRNKFYAGEFPIPAKKIFSKVLFDRKDVEEFLDKLPKVDC